MNKRFPITSLGLKRALKIAKEKEGYERCYRKDHGLGEMITINGVTKPARFVICPIVQFYPKPIFSFHTIEQFLTSSEKLFRERGWLNE